MLDLQTLLALTIVAAATAALARRVWRTLAQFRRNPSGGSCAGCAVGCGSRAEDARRQLVQLTPRQR